MQLTQAERQVFDQVCGGINIYTSNTGHGEYNITIYGGGDSGAGVLKGLGIYSLLLLSLIAAVIF